MRESTREFFDHLANVLLRCWIMGFGLLLIALVVIMLAGGLIDNLHGRMFGLSPHELDLIFYCWLGALKLIALVFFFIPWLSIWLMLRGISGHTHDVSPILWSHILNACDGNRTAFENE